MSWMERRRIPASRVRKRLTKDQLLGVANFITYGRIAVSGVVVLLLAFIHDVDGVRRSLDVTLSWSAMGLFVLASLSDTLDGYYARKYQVISTYGKFLDPLADKLLSLPTLIMLVALQRIPVLVVILLVVREVSITALRGIAAAEGFEIAASKWGKMKTLSLSFAIAFLLTHYPFWGIDPHRVGMTLLWLAVPISLGSGLHYVYAFFSIVIRQQRH